MDSGANPFIVIDLPCLLVRLEGVLLVVRDEFRGNVSEGERAEDVVGRAEPCGLLEDGNVRGDPEQEENDILDDS